MRFALLAFFFSLSLYGDEPSAFGAGNLESDNPYGLTSSEKVLLKNKQTLADIKKKSYANQNQVDALLERIDGLQTIVEGLNEKAQNNKNELKRMADDMDTDDSVQKLETVVKANESNIIQLKSVMDDFSKMIDTINSNYVSKADYNALVNDVNEFKRLVSKELKSTNVPKSSTSNKTSSSELATQAKANYDRERYTKAIEQYEILIERKYKPARANYMVGEMWYYRKDYGKAIAYFKASASLYDKASYMPTLMLHTAISMEHTGDKKNAQAFFRAIITKYPDSEAASMAQEKLN